MPINPATGLEVGAFRAWAATYGPLPERYLAIDLETSGLDRRLDLPIQVGWCEVEGGAAVRNEAVVLDWVSGMHEVEAASFSARLEKTRRSMASRGDDYLWTTQAVRERGVPPRAGLDRLAAVAATHTAFVAHFGWGFDYPMLGAAMDRVGLTFEPAQLGLWDTALLVKAAQTRLGPRPGEDLAEYVRRLGQARAAGKFSLRTCVELFDLHRRFGVDPNSQHSADYDAWVAHLIFESIRTISWGTWL